MSDSDIEIVRRVTRSAVLNQQRHREFASSNELIPIDHLGPSHFDRHLTVPRGGCGWETMGMCVSSNDLTLIDFEGPRPRSGMLSVDEMNHVRSFVSREQQPRPVLFFVPPARPRAGNMNVLRQQVASHYEKYWMRFKLGDICSTPDGQPLSQFKGRYQRCMRDIRDPIFRRGVNYNNNDNLTYPTWMQEHFWSIASHRYQMTFVVYTEENTHPLQPRETRIHHFDPTIGPQAHGVPQGKTVVYTYSGEYRCPKLGDKSWQCVVFVNGDHYDFLSSRFVSFEQLHRVLIPTIDRETLLPQGETLVSRQMGVFNGKDTIRVMQQRWPTKCMLL